MKTNLICRSLVASLLAGLLALDLYAAPGNLDSLDINVAGNADAAVYATAVQRDGKIIIGGRFTSVLGVPRNQVARLNADGTLDSSFNLNLSAFATVYAIALQPDGKILLGGVNVASIRGTTHIARYNVDGALDQWFDPKPDGSVQTIVVQADGKVVFGGFFTTVQPNGAATPTARNYLARVNPDGSLDAAFDPKPEFYVYSIAVQTDGKLVLGGFFRWLQPNGAATTTTRNYVARINPDGTLDPAFDPNPNFWVYCVAVQADGKVVFGGDFISIQPAGAPSATPRRRLARVNADGTLDSSYDPSPDGRPMSIALLADQTLLLGGYFTSFQPNGAPFAQLRSYIARLNPDGTLDGAFNPKANRVVRSITVQGDGRVLIGGEFTTLQPNGAQTATTRNFFARLLSYPTDQTLSLVQFGRVSALVWHRAGATPELTRATFEFSSDSGATFGAPIEAARSGATADWEVLLFRPPLTGVWRARGYTSDGQYNGSSSVIEQVLRLGSDRRLPIPGLFNTGVDSAGTPLTHGDLDRHYRLTPAPATGAPGAFTAVGGFPIPPWVDYSNPVSTWIMPMTGFNSDPGTYLYEITFDLTGMNLATASISGRWAADDSGDILLNGQQVGTSSIGFNTFTPFQIATGFNAGLNTLTFKVYNAGTSANPTGVRVEMAGVAEPDLRLTSIRYNSGNVTLQWISQPGRMYRVKSKTRLDQAWTDVAGDVPATSGISTKTFLSANTTGSFYAVMLVP